MPWHYHQQSGKLFHDQHYVTRGYSGHGSARDQPDQQSVRNEGPIPRGSYTIQAPSHHPHTGSYSLRLIPKRGTQTFGRDGFLIHGDSSTHPGQASNGCIILNRNFRQQVWESGDHSLEVER